MKYARIVNNMAVDVRNDSPHGFFAQQIADEFIEVPDEVGNHWTLQEDDATWVEPVIIDPVIIEPRIPIISPVTFKLLFTPQERLAIKAERLNDDILEDLFTILDDPRLKDVDLNLESNKAVMDYLQGKGLITEDRKLEILTGVMK